MIVTANIENQESSLSKIGEKQWGCLDSLAKHYKNSDMSKISLTSNFEDDTWDVIGSNLFNFRWKTWGRNEKTFPLILVCKITCYHAIQLNNAAISTIQIDIVGFINAFLKTLESKSILIAERNQPFNSLSQLTNEDILLLAQTSLVSDDKLSVQAYSGLNRIANTSNKAFPNAEFLTTGITSPWQDQSISIHSWARILKNSHGIDTTTQSYKPLTFDTVSSIVKSAIPFINDHFDTIKGVFDEIEHFHTKRPAYNNRKMNVYVGKVILKKYGKRLDKILPLSTYKADHQYEGLIQQTWYSEFEQLVQGASAWIILLTTGLRNVDMRNLEKGCCKASKRHDLLNYLITDLKKTHLPNYVLPVPQQTKKAVELLELAKVDRTGQFLLSQSTSKSTDNTTGDKRKINEGDTFNQILKKFATHYHIELNTISNNQNEATAHCVRATLAGYIGANSTAAILILKKLFGHSNALMPDAYLSHNPLIIAERHKNITNSQKTLADDMANGMISGKLSGTKGKQMLIGSEYIKSELNNELKNESLTQMQMQVNLKERIKEMLLSRIQENQIYALKTPMSVVCMRNCSDSSDTPCAKLGNHEKRKENGVSKEITDALATLPNPAQCVGKECSDALFGEAWSRDLLGTFDYYIKYLKAVGHQSIDIKNEAEIFVKNYGTILKDIYSDEREVGYFD